MSRSRILRWALAGAALGVAALRARAAEAAPAREIVELPKFEVTDSRLLPPPEAWLYAEIPGFEILSRISERETKRFMRDFLLLQTVIQEIMPGLLRGQTPVPTALILCGGKGKGFDEFVPEELTDERYGRNSLFFKTTERSAIVIDFALAELQVDADTRIEADAYRAFYAAYFRFLIPQADRRQGATVVRGGLVQLFAATEFDKKTITFAQIGDGFGAEKIGDFNRMLAAGGRSCPSPRCWRARGRRHVRRSGRRSATRRCTTAFMAWGRKTSVRSSNTCSASRTRSRRRSSSRRASREATGSSRSSSAATSTSRRTRKSSSVRRGTKGLAEPPAVPLRAAADHEVRTAQGRGAAPRRARPGGANTLIAPYVPRRARRAPARGARARREAIGQRRRARKFLEAATGAGVQRARAHLELGQPAPRAEARARRPRRINSSATSRSPRCSRRSSPRASSRRRSRRSMRSSRRPGRSPRSVRRRSISAWCSRACDVSPGMEPLLMQATLLAAKRGYAEEAKLLAERGLRITSDLGEQERFRLIASAFERDAAPAPETTPAPPPASPKSEDFILKRPAPPASETPK